MWIIFGCLDLVDWSRNDGMDWTGMVEWSDGMIEDLSATGITHGSSLDHNASHVMAFQH